jgi:hypothetical protein
MPERPSEREAQNRVEGWPSVLPAAVSCWPGLSASVQIQSPRHDHDIKSRQRLRKRLSAGFELFGDCMLAKPPGSLRSPAGQDDRYPLKQLTSRFRNRRPIACCSSVAQTCWVFGFAGPYVEPLDREGLNITTAHRRVGQGRSIRDLQSLDPIQPPHSAP